MHLLCVTMPTTFAGVVNRSPSLDDLVRSARAGQPSGLAGLYERYAASLHRTVYRLTGSADDAADVVHDVFVGLPEALRRYEECGALGPWLTRVAVRATFMRARGERRRREVPLAEARAVAAGAPSDAGAEHADVRRAVDALPDALRVVFVLKQVEGYSHDEIAALLGISAGASRVRLTRALDALRRALR